MPKQKIKSLFFFPNGNTAAFDKDGKQLPEAQQSWLLKFVKQLEENDDFQIGPDTVITLPDRSRARLFKTRGGNYNWEIL